MLLVSEGFSGSRHPGQVFGDAADVITTICLEMKGSSCWSWTTGLVFGDFPVRRGGRVVIGS